MIQLKVNGAARQYEGEADMPLLWYLRDQLQLTGSKFGCGMGLCGACTVHVNGEAVRSCLTPMSAVAGKEITTIEGLSVNGEHPVQKSLGTRARATMRLLSKRADHAGSCAAETETAAHRSRNRSCHVREHLPLRHVSAHPPGHQNRIWSEGGGDA